MPRGEARQGAADASSKSPNFYTDNINNSLHSHASTTTNTSKHAQTPHFKIYTTHRLPIDASPAPTTQYTTANLHPSLKTTPLLRHALKPSTPLPTHRQFSQTPLLQKKKTRADREEAASSQSSTAEVEDPYDFSTLESGIEKVLEKLKIDLGKLRTGGRFNPEVLENLRVHLVKDSKSSEKLGDLAQVLPKGGRSLMILVGEKDVSSFPFFYFGKEMLMDGYLEIWETV